MLRLFTASDFHGVYRCWGVLTSTVVKRQLTTFLRVRHHTAPALTRPYTEGPVWRDAPHLKETNIEEEEPTDLDKWKSVMRSKAATELRQQGLEEEAASELKDDNLTVPGWTSKHGSSLQATRDLVMMWRQAGKLVPQEISDVDLEELAKRPSKSAWVKYLKYLAIKERNKKAKKEKRSLVKQQREAMLEEKKDEEKELKNTMFLMHWSRTEDTLLAWRSAQAMVFDQPLVFDMSYDSSMSRRELENTVSQLMATEGWNRRAKEPFHLHYCNLQPGGAYETELIKRYGKESWERLLITSSHHQHVHLFDHKSLVYLTPDSRNVLHTFDPSKVYIIGAMVDKCIKPGLSLANAKRLNLTTARLPLNEFLRWELGSKNLTLDQMIQIMLTVKETGKWEEALKFVPTRKHQGFFDGCDRRRGVSDQGLRKDTSLSIEGLNTKRMFKNKDQSFNMSPDGDGTKGGSTDRKTKPAVTGVRVSFKSSQEKNRKPGKVKLW